MNTAIFTLLQITASFLIGIQHNSRVTPVLQEQGIAAASRVIQLSTQAMANVPFSIPLNNSAWPNIQDVMDAPYRDAQGSWVQVGENLTVISSSTSFGDLNGDGADDAAVLVERPSANGTPSFAIAALLNQGGILFNIADLPLGNSATVYSHSITDGVLTLDLQTGSEPRTTARYALLGNSFVGE